MDNTFNLFDIEKRLHYAERMYWKWQERAKYLWTEHQRLSQESKGAKQ